MNIIRSGRKNNKKLYLEIKRKSEKKYRKTLNGKINHSISTKLWFWLRGKKNGRSWKDILDYGTEELKIRLLETIPDGFFWKDYLNGKLHIDHIIPKNLYNYEKKDEIKKCWNLRNLRLIEAEENLSRSKGFDMELVEKYGLCDLIPESYINKQIRRF